MQPRGRIGALVVTAAAVLLLGSASTALARTSGADAQSTARPADLIPDASWHGRAIRRPVRTQIAIHEPASSIVVTQGAGLGQAGGAPAVREVQRRLLALGYRTGPVDGAFGPRTRSSVAWFQIKHQLPPTGVVDGATLAVLRFRTHAAPVTTATSAPAVAAGPSAPQTGRAHHPVRTTHPAPPSLAPSPVPAATPRRHADRAPGGISTLLTLIALVLALLVVAAITQWVRVRPHIPGRAQLRADLQKPIRLAAGLMPKRRPRPHSQPARARARAAAGRRGRSVGTVAATPAVAGNGAPRAANGNGHRPAANGNGHHPASNGNGRRVIGYALGRND